MKETVLFVVVLNRTELLDDLLIAFNEQIGQAATVLESVGMAQHFSQSDEAKIFATIKPFIISNHAANKTIFSVIPSEKLNSARKVVGSVLKDIDQPDTGIMFALPLLFQEGIQF